MHRGTRRLGQRAQRPAGHHRRVQLRLGRGAQQALVDAGMPAGQQARGLAATQAASAFARMGGGLRAVDDGGASGPTVPPEADVDLDMLCDEEAMYLAEALEAGRAGAGGSLGAAQESSARIAGTKIQLW